MAYRWARGRAASTTGRDCVLEGILSPPPKKGSGLQKGEKRRSPRVLVRVPVEIFSTKEDGRLFHGAGETEVVNEHGALLRMEHDLADLQAEEIILGHSDRWTLAWVLEPYPAGEDGVAKFAVEFSIPRKNFWVD